MIAYLITDFNGIEKVVLSTDSENGPRPCLVKFFKQVHGCHDDEIEFHI